MNCSVFAAGNRAQAAGSAVTKVVAALTVSAAGTVLPPTPLHADGRLQEFPQKMGSVHRGLLIFHFTADFAQRRPMRVL